MRITTRRLFGIILSFVLVLGVMPAVSLTVQAEENYPIWIGGVQVTSSNANDVFGDGKVCYFPADGDNPATLILNNYTYSGPGHFGNHPYDTYDVDFCAAIYAEESLKVTLVGDSRIQAVSTSENYTDSCGVYSNENLSIDGDGSLTAIGVSGEGIWGRVSVTISSGTVNASGAYRGITSLGYVVINGGEVEAIGTDILGEEDDAYGISSDNYDVIIGGGTVKAIGTDSGIFTLLNDVIINSGTVTIKSGVDGIMTFSGSVSISGGTVSIQGDKNGIHASANVTISGGTAIIQGGENGINNYHGITISGGTVTASGDNEAVLGFVMNSVEGTGWTNIEGTEGKEDIAISIDGQALTYKKVQFPRKPSPTPEPQDPSEYTDPVSGEVIPELVDVPETDEAGTVIEKQSDGSVTVTDAELGTAGQISPAVFAEGQVYRLYNPNTGEHFYTKNPEERDALSSMGWNYESEQTTKTIASSEEGAAPVYRVYNPYTGLHHYTCDKSEALWLKDMGWNYEGISMYAYEKGSGYGTPTYRLYAPFPDAHGQYQHIFTVHEDERIALLMAGYNDEGIAWNVK